MTPTCFLVTVLFVHFGPVEMPARKDRPVPFIPDPQTWLQSEVRLHVEKALSSAAQVLRVCLHIVTFHTHDFKYQNDTQASCLSDFPTSSQSDKRFKKILTLFLKIYLGYYLSEMLKTLDRRTYSKNTRFL